MITEHELRQIMPSADVELWAGPLNDAMAFGGINTPKRMAMFVAQIAHESGELRFTKENLNYSAIELRRIWPSRFDPAMAAKYARKPEQIANIAYAGRMGNGPGKSGDGWRFRGRGPIQITGRNNYRDCGEFIGADLLHEPDLLLLPRHGARSAVWFFVERANGIALADVGNLAANTRRINGGMNGWDSRLDYYHRAIRVLGAA